MPGMAMSGCAHLVGSPMIHLGTPGPVAPSAGLLAGLLVSLALAILGLTMFLWRLGLHRQIFGYGWVTDWLGHGGAHAVGMILMATLMLGWVPTIGPASAYLIAYGGLALLFAVRAVTARTAANRSDDLWHVFVQLSMVYMFGVLSQGPAVALTAASLVFYAALTGDHIRETLRKAGPDAALRGHHGPGRAAGTIGHLAISSSMVIMFAVMQWPALFGRAG